MNKIIFPSLAIALFAVGCGHPIDGFVDASREYAEVSCQCPELSGSDLTTTECLAELEATLASTEYQTAIECMRDVYDRHSESIKPASDCEVDALQDVTRCLETAGCNAAAATTCNENHRAASDRCPGVPPAVDAETEACFG